MVYRIIVLVVVSVFLFSCIEKNDENLSSDRVKSEKSVITTADEAIAELKKGNERFLNNGFVNTDYQKQIEATKEKQKPHSVVLSCMDSRVPPEIIFDQGIGNIFVLRNAGNIEDENILGSMEYAVKYAGSKLIVVMGHTHCGAVTGAIKDVKDGNLTQLVEQIKPAIPEDRDVSELITITAKNSVNQTIADILSKSSIIKELVDTKQIKLIGVFYDIETGKVVFE